jgi:hypothetical protein
MSLLAAVVVEGLLTARLKVHTAVRLAVEQAGIGLEH